LVVIAKNAAVVWHVAGRAGFQLRNEGGRTVAGSARMGPFLIRAGLTGFALWVVTLFVHGIYFVGYHTPLQKIGIIFVVGVIFGLVNAVIKPVVQILSIPLYILTLGLFHIVINAFMLWITAWITEHTTHWGLYIEHFWWTAIWAAILLSIVSWLLSLIVRDVSGTRRK
jgi:putative membrane protein